MTDLNEQKKIAVIGDKDTVLIFKALGFDVFYENEAIGIKRVLRGLIDEQYTIILITEKHAELAAELIQSRAEIAYPIILPIPDGIMNTGYGIQRIAKNIEKALGGIGGGLK